MKEWWAPTSRRREIFNGQNAATQQAGRFVFQPRHLLGLFCYAFLGGCASVSVDQRQRDAERVANPKRIYVQAFTGSREAFRVDRKEKDLRGFRRDFTSLLQSATVERVTKKLVPAVPLAAGDIPAREEAWLVTGRYVRVNQGSRALRTVLGFGLGGTKLETEVTVYDLSGRKPRPFLTFRTTGGSGAQPGVALGLAAPNLWLLSLDTVAHLGPGLSFDVIRTSRQIVAALSESMAQDGFIPREKVYRTKRRGSWP